MIIERDIVQTLEKRLKEPCPLQVVLGPRQVGKTTALQQLIRRWSHPSHYATADLPSPPDSHWIQTQWQMARQLIRHPRRAGLLVLDEVQKVSRWSEVVKALVDEDRRERIPLRVVLLGSSSLQVRKGAQESLAGRFELLFCPHWSYEECRKAFGWKLEEWLYFGGYPGSARMRRSQDRWSLYIRESLVESVLARDVLHLSPVLKPALLRQLFSTVVRCPAQILSYNKMLGSLQDAGNTVTLAHYLQLLSNAYLVTGLQQWHGGAMRVKGSIPKIVVWNNALINGMTGIHLKETRRQTDVWGHLVENAVGAHLLNHAVSEGFEVYYWRHGNDEVDYVIRKGNALLALEVKSGERVRRSGLGTFLQRWPKAKTMIVGTGGIPFPHFFSVSPKEWF